jgi:hypothetical protein
VRAAGGVEHGVGYESQGYARAEGRYATQVLVRLTGKPYDVVLTDISAAAEKYRAKREGSRPAEEGRPK